MVVTLEGIVEPTGNSVQARSSYLPNEILWGHRYQNMMTYNKKKGIYTVDCSNLNAVTQDDTPRISAKQADERRRLEAKRLSQLRRKISAISQNSVRSPTAKLSVFNNPRNMTKCHSLSDYGAGRWNDEDISAAMTTSTICDKSEMDNHGSLPTVTVVNTDKRKSTVYSPPYVQSGPSDSKIWVTNSSGQATVHSNTNSSGEQDYPNELDEIGQLENVEGGVKIRMDANHIDVEINPEV